MDVALYHCVWGVMKVTNNITDFGSWTAISENTNLNSLCYSNHEEESCSFASNTGYAMIGSSSRTCTTTGWTGTHPFCDGNFNY